MHTRPFWTLGCVRGRLLSFRVSKRGNTYGSVKMGLMWLHICAHLSNEAATITRAMRRVFLSEPDVRERVAVALGLCSGLVEPIRLGNAPVRNALAIGTCDEVGIRAVGRSVGRSVGRTASVSTADEPATSPTLSLCSGVDLIVLRTGPQRSTRCRPSPPQFNIYPDADHLRRTVVDLRQP